MVINPTDLALLHTCSACVVIYPNRLADRAGRSLDASQLREHGCIGGGGGGGCGGSGGGAVRSEGEPTCGATQSSDRVWGAAQRNGLQICIQFAFRQRD